MPVNHDIRGYLIRVSGDTALIIRKIAAVDIVFFEGCCPQIGVIAVRILHDNLVDGGIRQIEPSNRVGVLPLEFQYLLCIGDRRRMWLQRIQFDDRRELFIIYNGLLAL